VISCRFQACRIPLVWC